MMPLFGKSDNKPKLIETVGPVPEGYHSESILISEEITASGIGAQLKVLKDLQSKCRERNLDGFANLKFTAAGAETGAKITVFGYADGIKQN
ncbi:MULTISPECIES: hypothetical protein [Furfurilactobacillus]|nr:hypothetical protein [Furfurilactobacillus milii]MCF6161931.1 hypothetical protein [Furfurilactobacillus milii]